MSEFFALLICHRRLRTRSSSCADLIPACCARRQVMLVRVQSSGRKTLGLVLRDADVHDYFPERVPSVELRLGELRINCELKPEFWNFRPVICDRRLSDWLNAKVFHDRACRMSPSLEMTPCGKNSFTLSAPRSCDVSTCMWPPEVTASCIAGLVPIPQHGSNQPHHSEQRPGFGALLGTVAAAARTGNPDGAARRMR